MNVQSHLGSFSQNTELLQKLFESFENGERQNFLHFIQCANHYGIIQKSASRKFSMHEPKNTEQILKERCDCSR